MEQEYLIKLSIIEQEAGQLQERMQIIDQQIQEMQAIKKSLTDIKEKKEILSNLGKGIFVKTEVKEKNLFVNIGKNIVIKKETEDTQRIIDDQIEKLFIGKEEIMSRIENLQKEMTSIIQEVQKEAKTKNHECCEENCECEKD